MKKISIPVDADEVLNNFTTEEIVKFYGANDLLEHITDKEFLELSDIDHLLCEIDDMYEDAIGNFVKEKYED